MDVLEKYLHELNEIRASGEATDETSYYPPLCALLDDIGHGLKPQVRCILTLKNRGAGIPDGGLFSKDQFQKLKGGQPIPGQKPARGAIEVKSTKDDAWVTANSDQVTKYWKEYGQVLVTNYRDFVLLGRDSDAHPVKLASCRLAESEKEFWNVASHPQKAAAIHSARFQDFLKLVLLSPAILAAPKDVAWVLAYYAREAKARVDLHHGAPALDSVRQALEQALGLKFEGEKGEHFFRSSLVQTLFYGVFSAWVLWSKQRTPKSPDRFDWRLAQWSLRVPMIRALFEQVATPGHLGELGHVEVLDWTASALNRVDRAEFFARFQEQDAVQYFYEPFLEAFDPELRKELGVWYTPREIVQYMVARTHAVLREELGLEDGLADPNVYVLDPACGTGAYLVEVLKTIAETLKGKGDDGLIADDVKRAARERVFGFEILPAPFVISHLQLGLLLQNLGAPLKEDSAERVGVYLTNSLTGWEPPKGPKQHLIFPEMEAERDAAENVKQSKPILVVIGNPPYNGFAGVGMDEEQILSNAYRTTKRAPAPEGQGLNDLYVRFYRMAERRIVEQTGEGVVCFISNYSWLDGRSHTGMRERYLEVFNAITIDCLNGDKYKTGKLTPAGESDPSIFSTEQNPEGIQVGTTIALLVRRRTHAKAPIVQYRDFWGKTKREDVLKSLSSPLAFPYTSLQPEPRVGYPLMPRQTEDSYFEWPMLPQLLPEAFPGVKTSRDSFLVDFDRDALEERIGKYFDTDISNGEMAQISAQVMENTARFNAKRIRHDLQRRGSEAGRIVRYQYRPFDVRWLYWEPETKLLDEKRFDYFQQVKADNLWLSAGQRNRMEAFYQPQFTTLLADHHIVESNVAMFPLTSYPTAQAQLGREQRPHSNLTPEAESYLTAISCQPIHLFHHILSCLHAVSYSSDNGGALRQDWPRIPLPAPKDALLASAKLGNELAALLNTEVDVKGITAGTTRPELKGIGNITPVQGKTINPSTDLEIDAGWGHAGKDGATMPGKGTLVERDYTSAERDAIAKGAEQLGLTLDQALLQLGATTCDVFLNERAYWKNVPKNVWEYYIGGYQVMKKWLSYREAKLLGRSLSPDEARYVQQMARRIAAICLLQPELDANYAAVKSNTYAWPK